jgi:hypothetical protein
MPITLTEAMDAYYLYGDRTKLGQYEREKQAAELASLAAEQRKKDTQAAILALAHEHPALNTGPGYEQFQREYAAMEDRPYYQGALEVDLPDGGKLNMAKAATVAERLKAQPMQEPAAPATPKPATPEAPVPGRQPQGDLLDDPSVMRAMAHNGMGKTRESRYAWMEKQLGSDGAVGSRMRVTRGGKVVRY